MTLVRYLHLLAMAFVVGGQILLAAAVVPWLRADSDRERLRAIASLRVASRYDDREGPPAVTKSASAAVEFGASEAASFECRLDGGDWAACASPGKYAGLADR